MRQRSGTAPEHRVSDLVFALIETRLQSERRVLFAASTVDVLSIQLCAAGAAAVRTLDENIFSMT